MKGIKKLLNIILITGLLIGLTACSSSTEDSLTTTSKLFSAINRVEKFNPGGMSFTKEQAEQILKIIDPVVEGAIYTSELAADIYKQMDKLLTKNQKNLIDTTIASLGVPVEGAVPGSGAGQGGGMGGMGAGQYGGTPPTGSTLTENGANMFFRIYQVITDNYLSE